jgi:hypothetical protein
MGGSHVHAPSIGQWGAQLYSGSIATPMPQTFSVASPPVPKAGFGVGAAHLSVGESRAAPRPRSTRFEPVECLRSVDHWFTLVTPSDLARRTRTVWQFRHVPPLSGMLPTLTAVPRVRLPPASPGRCDGLEDRSLTSLDRCAPRGALRRHPG